MSGEYHIPVLLHESVDGLAIEPDGTYVDVTFGGGGHSREILRRLGPAGRLIAFDQDEQACANRPDDDRLTLVHHNFKYIAQFLQYLGIAKVDGILADLGVSSHHFDAPERGFSFRFDAPLDMRMGQGAGQTAANIVNNYSVQELAAIFARYGEIQHPSRLAAAIVAKRTESPIDTTGQLRDIATSVVPKNDQNKLLAKLFQALRIEVNNEMEALRQMLGRTPSVLRTGGRLVVISYHSLEDRMVKNMMRSGNCDLADPERDIYGHAQVPFEAVSRKPITPPDDEIERNSRARSAKLRIAQRTEYE